jgi:hypothetical protein
VFGLTKKDNTLTINKATTNGFYFAFSCTLEQFYINQLMETFDANEGINSFIDKRKPEWRNI